MAMADNTIYDLLDEVNCADSCEAVTALCELIVNVKSSAPCYENAAYLRRLL